MWQLRQRHFCPSSFHYLSRYFLVSLMKEQEQSFEIGCGCFFFLLPVETAVKFNEAIFYTSYLIAANE